MFLKQMNKTWFVRVLNLRFQFNMVVVNNFKTGSVRPQWSCWLIFQFIFKDFSVLPLFNFVISVMLSRYYFFLPRSAESTVHRTTSPNSRKVWSRFRSPTEPNAEPRPHRDKAMQITLQLAAPDLQTAAAFTRALISPYLWGGAALTLAIELCRSGGARAAAILDNRPSAKMASALWPVKMDIFSAKHSLTNVRTFK